MRLRWRTSTPFFFETKNGVKLKSKKKSRARTIIGDGKKSKKTSEADAVSKFKTDSMASLGRVLVTGGTGRVGREVIARLSQSGRTTAIRCTSHNPDKAEYLKTLGATVSCEFELICQTRAHEAFLAPGCPRRKESRAGRVGAWHAEATAPARSLPFRLPGAARVSMRVFGLARSHGRSACFRLRLTTELSAPAQLLHGFRKRGTLHPVHTSLGRGIISEMMVIRTPPLHFTPFMRGGLPGNRFRAVAGARKVRLHRRIELERCARRGGRSIFLVAGHCNRGAHELCQIYRRKGNLVNSRA